jgi:hypothetical protein
VPAGGERDAGSFQLGLNPYPFDVALRAGRVLPVTFFLTLIRGCGLTASV